MIWADSKYAANKAAYDEIKDIGKSRLLIHEKISDRKIKKGKR